MGRNLKSGMDYFDHSTTAHADIKLEKVMAWYGAEGYAVYFYLLEKIYAEPEYELQIDDDDTLVLIANRLKIDTNKLRDIIAKCVSVGLFDEEKYQLARILTSHGIKKRADEVETARENKRNYRNNRLQNKNCSEKNGDCSGKNADSSEKNGILDGENAHIKTEQNRTDKNRTEQIKTEQINNNECADKKPQKHRFGKYQNVLLTDAEYNRLVNEPDGEKAIEYLSTHREMTGYKCKNDNLAIRKWVFTAVKEQEIREARVNQQYAKIEQKPQQSTNPFLDLAMRGRASK